MDPNTMTNKEYRQAKREYDQDRGKWSVLSRILLAPVRVIVAILFIVTSPIWSTLWVCGVDVLGWGDENGW